MKKTVLCPKESPSLGPKPSKAKRRPMEINKNYLSQKQLINWTFGKKLMIRKTQWTCHVCKKTPIINKNII
jgi:hypothetical protein